MQVNEDFSRLPKIKDIGRWYVTKFVEDVAKSLPAGSSILDAGAGECVYKRLFSHCEYRAIDLGIGETSWNYGNLDYVGPLHDMLVESNAFDAVLCTQVLEHLECSREPWRRPKQPQIANPLPVVSHLLDESHEPLSPTSICTRRKFQIGHEPLINKVRLGGIGRLPLSSSLR